MLLVLVLPSSLTPYNGLHFCKVLPQLRKLSVYRLFPSEYPRLLALFCLAACLFVSGCRAPLPEEGLKQNTAAREIILIEETERQAAPWQLVEKNGQELWQVPDPVGQHGGTLYLATIGQGPKTMNPWASFDATSSQMGGYLVAGLVRSNPDTGEVEPYLAKRIDILPDDRTYRATLRQGLTWSDGKPLTSKDVVFTWNTIVKRALGNPSIKGIVTVDGQFPRVRALDRYTIEFQTSRPFAPFLRSLNEPIAPAHLFKPLIDKGGDEAFRAAWTSQEAAEHPEHFISSDLWLLDSYVPDQRMVFKRNPKATLIDSEGQRLPYINRVVVQFVKDNNNLQLQFEQGAMDIYAPPPNYVARLQQLKKPDFNLYNLGPSATTTFLVFNLHQGKNRDSGEPLVDATVSSWFHQQRFRQAIAWALDRDLMVETILKGVGSPLYTAESPKSIFIHEELAKGHSKDVAKARALLKSAGFHWNQQGKLLDAKGNRVRFTLNTNAGNDIREAAGLAIQQDLAELGITVDFKAVEFNSLLNRMQEGHWETIVLGLTGGDPFEPHFSANVWKSDAPLHLFYQRRPEDISKLPPLPWEREIDRLFERGSRLLEPEKRRPIYNRYQQILFEQAPMIYLYSPQDIIAVRQRLQNVRPTLLGGVQHNLHALWLSSKASSG